MPYDQIRLASSSPRRRQLLAQIGVRHVVGGVDIDESRQPSESPIEYVLRLAAEKAWAAHAKFGGDGLPVLAADTAVALGDAIFGKPADRDDCRRILAALSGRRHEVLTAVALVEGGRSSSTLSLSHVSFRDLDPAEIDAYWDSGEPREKAGAYAIQGLGAVFVARLEGSHSGVMGLPLYETAALLDAAGVRRWQQAPPP